MPRTPKPWFRKQTGSWYVQYQGQKICLGKDKEKAHQKFYALMAGGGRRERVKARTLIMLYADWIKEHNAPSTVDRRKPLLVSFGNFLPPSLWAGDLKPLHVHNWIKSQPRIKSPTTANTRITLVKSVWNWGRDMGYMDRNPIAHMKKPKARVRQEFVPADLWQRAIAIASDQEFRDYLILLLTTGARPAELHDLEARHVQGDRIVFPIEESKGRERSRVIYLPTEATGIIQRLVAERPEGPLLTNSKGRPWTRNAVRCRFRCLKRELGIPNLCATTLRHSFAHYRLTNGQDALTVAKLMGHVDTRMLATRYGHLDESTEFMQKAANQVRLP